MRYEVVEEPGTFLEIATTRPETLMGDTGVAVNPTIRDTRDLSASVAGGLFLGRRSRSSATMTSTPHSGQEC